ncbi:MAG: peroxidase-related enzyme [Chitinophagales bacterium]|jgi:uncharacterized peroxidase-related enzyme|nr:peroxidase-related enzyme [Sphingobacteriales bacterium]MCC7057969.1 peroxidase-related enzyme [Chitinophagales bacterium]MDA0197178.1 peroxidase-related enzyme [Bacteroidota bacterium]
MPHIPLNETLNGIRSLMAFSPQTALPINQMAEALLRPNDPNFTNGERELIGAFVSYLNECFFCQNVHGAIAQHYLRCDIDFIDGIKANYTEMPISNKLKALLQIAASVQKGGKFVTAAQIAEAKNCGATDSQIHDTVLIAAFFCMCNRYVDGLQTTANPNRQFYVNNAERRANEGYLQFDLYK